MSDAMAMMFDGIARAAVLRERQRIAAAIRAMDSDCHSRSGLACERDWTDDSCSLLDGHRVLAVIENAE